MKEILFDLLDNDVKGIEMKSTKVHFGDKLWVENTVSGDKFKNNNVVLNFSAEHNSLKVSKVNIMKCMGENKDICIYEGIIINNQIQYIKK